MSSSLISLHGSAIKHDREPREMGKEARTSWVRLAVKLIPFHAKREYEQLGMTWDDWLDSALQITRETADRMLRVTENLLKGIKVEEIEKISKANCEVLYQQVPIPKRFKKEIVEAAQNLSKPKLLQMLSDGKNNWQLATPDKRRRITIDCDESLVILWEGVCQDKVREKPGAKAFEKILNHISLCNVRFDED